MNRSLSSIAGIAALAGLAVSGAAGCTASGFKGDSPTVTLFTPEPDTIARHYVAVSGEATGNGIRVQVQIDSDPPIDADGTKQWSKTLDITTLGDGAHSVKAIVTDNRSRTSQTFPVSFVAASATGGVIGGTVDDNNTAIAGATVTTFESLAAPATTDITGHYAFTGLTPGVTATVRGSAAGFRDTLFYSLIAGGDDLFIDVPMFSSSTLDAIASQCATSVGAGTSTVIGFVVDSAGNSSVGSSVFITPVPETTCYLKPDGNWDSSIQATTAAGVFIGFGVAAGGPVSLVASNGGATFFYAGSHAVADAVSLLVAQEAAQ